MPKFNEEHVVRFMQDAEGNSYGPENNPKRAGSKSAERFAQYRDGMTVKEARAAGLSTADLAYDIEHNYIVVRSAD